MSLLDGRKPHASSPPASQLFADALAAQAVPVTQVDWRPPLGEPGIEADLARVLADPRRGPRQRRRRSTGCSRPAPSWSTSGPAAEALGLARGEFLHAGPPIGWDRAAGPLRGALIGALLLEGLAATAGGGRGGAGPRRRRVAGPVPPPPHGRADGRRGQPVDVDVRAARPGARRHRLVLAERGPRQGAALRRLRPGGRSSGCAGCPTCSGRCCRRRCARHGAGRRQGDRRADAADGRRGAQPQPRRAR